MATDLAHNSTPRRPAIVVLLFAFGLTVYAGRLGLFAMDQSILFDAGYRVYCGQVPYRDFMMPFGPVTAWLQGAMFAVCGVNFYAPVVGAALFNVIGTAAAMGILRQLLPAQPQGAWIGGAVTAAWLYAPFGTLYPEQTAFTFILVALWAYLRATDAAAISLRGRYLAALLAGACLTAAVLTKQNAGLPAGGLLALIALLRWEPERRPGKNLLCATFGATAVAAAFAAWLVQVSDPAAFVEQVLRIPAAIGRQRMTEAGLREFACLLLGGKGNDLLRILLADFAVIALVVAGWTRHNRRRLPGTMRTLLAAPMLCVACVGYQNFFSLSSSNDGANEKPFLGLIVALAWGLLHGAAMVPNPTVRPLPARWMIVTAALGGVLSLLVQNATLLAAAMLALGTTYACGLFAPVALPPRVTLPSRWVLNVVLPLTTAFLWLDGVGISVGRQVHEAFAGPGSFSAAAALTHRRDFPAEIAEPRLQGLRWGRRTHCGATVVEQQDLLDVIGYLRETKAPFFVFPDFTFLYAVLDQPSPQPLLWFHAGLTYPREYSPELDRRIVAELERRAVRTYVREADAYGESRNRLTDFPLVQQYLAEHFAFDRRLGFFELYVKREVPQAATGDADRTVRR